MIRCSSVLYFACLLGFIGAVCAAPARGGLPDDKFSLLENRDIATRSICSEWYNRLKYAIWKHVCGHKTPHEFVRRFDPTTNLRNSPVIDMDDDIQSEDWDRLKELLFEFRRSARDGGAQFETPMYII